MWRDDPSTTMVIGWDQRSGSDPVLLYDTEDRGQVAKSYRFKQKPDRISKVQGMNSHFVRLSGLKPATVYYFIVFDTEGPGKRFSFRTAPAVPDERLSIIAGGDSRNHREARVDANKVVSKLRPHCILFGGDMTEHDTPTEWQEWMDDWQHTIGSDGRLFPVIATRGNHESSNTSIVELFDTPSPDVYYALSLGGNLLRVYTLNTLFPVSGDQRDWLQRDLAANQQSIWRFAQYHQAVRPHTSSKLDRDDILLNWSTLFFKYKVQVAVECDAHVVKTTWPVKPSKEPGSDQGFIRDDNNGTVYLGEGTWGAPLRANDDDKKWTLASGSFNQFSWIFVDQRRVEIRTVRTDGADRVKEVDPNNIFDPPLGLVLWNPPSGDVMILKNKDWKPTPGPDSPVDEADTGVDLTGIAAVVKGKDILVQWVIGRDKKGMSYEIQRSIDGGARFAVLTKIPSKGEGKQPYEFQDRGFGNSAALSKTIYRIKCLYPDGTFSFHETRPGSGRESDREAPPISRLKADEKGLVRIEFDLEALADVEISLVTTELKEIAKLTFPNEPKGPISKTINLSKAPQGEYILIIKADGKTINRFAFSK